MNAFDRVWQEARRELSSFGKGFIRSSMLPTLEDVEKAGVPEGHRQEVLSKLLELREDFLNRNRAHPAIYREVDVLADEWAKEFGTQLRPADRSEETKKLLDQLPRGAC